MRSWSAALPLLCGLLALPAELETTPGSSLSLTILHTNDVHARFEEANAFGGPCSQNQTLENKCFGGVARLKTKVTEIRNEEKNVLFLDAGDYYQGSLLFTEFTYNITSVFTNMLKYDAVALGNHEFDNGVAGLVPYLDLVKFPVLACNLDLSEEPSMQGKTNCSRVFQLAGEKVAVLGYITPDTKELASTGKVIFLDEVESLQTEVERLQKTQGINKFIALGHSGFGVDKDIARKVKGLDVVVGGHSHTFLYTDEPPTEEDNVADLYPTVIAGADGNQVLVVQAYNNAKYLGHLRVQFDEEGRVTSFSGNPVLLNGSVPMDPEVTSALQPYVAAVAEKTKQVVGTSYVILRGDRQKCRQEECNLGNFIADACVRSLLRGPPLPSGHWSKYSVALWNSGAIRASIDVGDRGGNVTMGDVLSVAPFRNTIDGVTLYGRDLKQVMEFSVSKYDVTGQNSPGGFLQVSGMQVTYDMGRPAGQRVVELYVLCSKCRVPKYQAVVDDQEYHVIVPSYLLGGGDGFKLLKEKALNVYLSEKSDSEVLLEHLDRVSPVTAAEERRIRFVRGTNQGSRACPLPLTLGFVFLAVVLLRTL